MAHWGGGTVDESRNMKNISPNFFFFSILFERQRDIRHMAANGKAKGSASRDFLTSKPIAFIGCDSHSRGAVDGVRVKSERKKLFDNKTPSPENDGAVILHFGCIFFYQKM